MFTLATVVLMAIATFQPLAALAAPTYLVPLAVRNAEHEMTYIRREKPTTSPPHVLLPPGQASFAFAFDLCTSLITEARKGPGLAASIHNLEAYKTAQQDQSYDFETAFSTGELTAQEYCLAAFPDLAQEEEPLGGSSGGSSSSSNGERPASTPASTTESPATTTTPSTHTPTADPPKKGSKPPPGRAVSSPVPGTGTGKASMFNKGTKGKSPMRVQN